MKGRVFEFNNEFWEATANGTYTGHPTNWTVAFRRLTDSSREGIVIGHLNSEEIDSLPEEKLRAVLESALIEKANTQIDRTPFYYPSKH